MAHDTTGSVVPSSLHRHFEAVIQALCEGRVIPFLGTEANLCGRPANQNWKHSQREYLPSSSELAEHLAKKLGGPQDGKASNLIQVSQFVALTAGTRQLYDQLHDLFDRDYPPTPLHQMLAHLPAFLRANNDPVPYPLIVTTNYDDLLETAFRNVNEPVDVVAYVAEGMHHGKFLHRPPEDEARLIERPNEHRGLMLKQRAVILKIHGAVDRNAPEHDSFMITEDHYINFLTRTGISNLMACKLTLLYGASGVGKSSVLHAGITHHLRQLTRANLVKRGRPEHVVIIFGACGRRSDRPVHAFCSLKPWSAWAGPYASCGRTWIQSRRR